MSSLKRNLVISIEMKAGAEEELKSEPKSGLGSDYRRKDKKEVSSSKRQRTE